MIVYESTKETFMKSVEKDSIVEEIEKKYQIHFGKSGEAQVQSWKNSLEYMYKVVNDAIIPQNAGVAIEFNIPATSKRIDFILSGYGSHNEKTCIIIELKQWSKCERVEGKDGIVRTFVGHAEREVTHPSYQATSYQVLLKDFNEVVEKDNIQLFPCAYLHNYDLKQYPDVTNAQYQLYIDNAPLFGKGDVLKLRSFIEKYIKVGDNREILFEMANGKIRPSKMLQDNIASMLKGNREFTMIDDQKVIFEEVLHLADGIKNGKKKVLIASGGPGTGKTVIAVNLLSALLNKQYVVSYVTKNAAPRNVFFKKLNTQGFKGVSIKNLFISSGAFVDSDENDFDVLLVDEAHRLNEKSGMFNNLGENQIKEIIHASKVSVFFLDEHQRVTTKDIGSSEEIKKFAKMYDADVKTVVLQSQFRCNGSDGYLAWLDNILQIRDTANYDLSDIDYDIKVFDSPSQMQKAIVEKNQNNKARIVAGYCWDWPKESQNDTRKPNIIIDDFQMSWNLKNTSTWAIDTGSINEAGCIHTCQGLEFDYIGVIIGDDMRFENGKIITDFTKRSKDDQSIKGLKKLCKENPTKANKLAEGIIKNTYRTLLTRGMKGCYIYCTDTELANHIKRALNYGDLH